jgi:PAS domain S-box-containing protein
VKLPRIAPEDSRQTILLFRWLLVLTSVLLMLHGPYGLKATSGGYALAIFFFLSNIGLTCAPPKIFKRAATIAGIMGLDLVLVSLVIYYTGGAITDLFLLYLFVIFTALPASSLPVSLVIALFASAYYAVITCRTAGAVALLETAFLIKVPFFFLIAAFGSLISRQTSHLIKQRDENQRLSTELRWKLEKAMKSEEKLHDDLALLYTYNENILNTIESGVVAIDLNGTITAFNRAAERITGLKSGHVLFEETAVDKTLEELGAIMMEALEAPVRRREIEIKTAYGETKTLGISTYLMKQKRQKVVGVVAVFADLTEIRQLQKKLKNSENLTMLGEMAACVAHELRNPLSSIQGLSELMISGSCGTEETGNYADTILREAQRIDRTIQEILNFSSTRKPEKSALDLNLVLEEAIESIAGDAERANATIDWRPATGLPLLSGDKHQIHKVFTNVILNAVQAFEDGGTVRVDASLERGEVLVSVKDDGPGIPTRIRRKVFNPFFTTKDGGTGLGLSIARKIVEDHDGSMELSSSEGKGTEFSIHLPLAETPVSQEVVVPGPDETEKTILVADDDAYIRDIFTEVLAADGYDVILAEDGEEAIRKAVSNEIDLMILDIKMPIIDGLQVMEHMHKVKPALPVIVTTGYADMKDDFSIRNANVVEYLQKPVHVAEFRGAVFKALKNGMAEEAVGIGEAVGTKSC